MVSGRYRGEPRTVKKCVFVVRLVGRIDLPSSWPDNLFPAVQQCIFLSHTRIHSQGLASFFQFPPSLPHCPRSISLSCHHTPSPTYTDAIRWNIRFFFSLPTWETCQPVCALMLVFAFTMRSTVSQAPQVTGEPFQITHITNKLDWIPSWFSDFYLNINLSDSVTLFFCGWTMVVHMCHLDAVAWMCWKGV